MFGKYMVVLQQICPTSLCCLTVQELFELSGPATATPAEALGSVPSAVIKKEMEKTHEDNFLFTFLESCTI